jgi:hypothetical protein
MNAHPIAAILLPSLVVAIFFGFHIWRHKKAHEARQALAELKRLQAIEDVKAAKALNASLVAEGKAPLICERCGLREIEKGSSMCW